MVSPIRRLITSAHDLTPEEVCKDVDIPARNMQALAMSWEASFVVWPLLF